MRGNPCRDADRQSSSHANQYSHQPARTYSTLYSPRSALRALLQRTGGPRIERVARRIQESGPQGVAQLEEDRPPV